MTDLEKIFLSTTKSACENKNKKQILKHNLKQYFLSYEKGKTQFSNLETAKNKLHFIKYKTIENIEKYINEFETKFSANGGKVFFASSDTHAKDYILGVIKQQETTKVLKSKSMVCEEIGLEEFLNASGISILETDLGEFIVQLAGEKPSHITAPALHKSAKEIYNLLNEKYEQNFNESTPVEIVVSFVRNLLREEFMQCQVGITGANFIVADPGLIAITENEGNALLSSSSQVLIVVTTIEKLIPSLQNLELFQTMLSSHGTGQKITAYNHLISGPAKQKEKSGPSQIHLILIDNNRTDIIKDVFLRESMYCIKCGACHNFCPVFRHIGGHTYNSTYSGPIGSIISPSVFGVDYAHLPFASTLCGKCNEVCPVRLNLTQLLIYRRKQLVQSKVATVHSNTKPFRRMQYFLRRRKRMDMFSSGLKNLVIRMKFKNSWGIHREIPKFQKNSFNSIKKQKKN